MRTMWSDAPTSRTDWPPMSVAVCGHARVCTPAVGRRMSTSVCMDHLATARGGARMEGSGASLAGRVGRPARVGHDLRTGLEADDMSTQETVVIKPCGWSGWMGPVREWEYDAHDDRGAHWGCRWG